MNFKIRIIFPAVLFFFFAAAQAGSTKDLSGAEIISNSFNRNDGQASYSKVEMVLVDRRGNQRPRMLEIYTKDYESLKKMSLRFSEPADIRGTKFLSWENEGKDDTQYLYLPALGRARRVVSSQKDLRFVNTDFTYEDMQRRHPDNDEHKLIGDEYSGKYDCYVVESIPKAETSQYSKRVVWIDKKNFVVIKTDFYNPKGEKCKQFRASELESKEGIWTAMAVSMENLKDGHKTLMNTKEVVYNLDLDDEIFTVYDLEKE